MRHWNRWWEKNRDNRGFLGWGTDPHPKSIDPPNKQAAQSGSGLDNSPLFDDAIFNEQKYFMELADVGLMGLYLADCHYLIEIARELGFQNDNEEIQQWDRHYSKKLKERGDEKSGIFRDKDLAPDKFSTHLAPTNFYPLLAGIPTQKQAERMVNEHLLNPDEFYGDLMLPSIARNAAGFKDNPY